MKKWWLSLALFLPLLAIAGSVSVSWTACANTTDNTGKCTPTGYNLYEGSSATTLTKIATVPPTQLTYVFTGLSPGTAFVAVSTTAADGEGAKSTVASGAVIPSLPLPSTITITSTIGATAFYIIQQPGKLVMLDVGTLNANVDCDPSNAVIAQGKPYYAVPNSAVDWYGGKAKPGITVMAQCGAG